jgi:hypothetical protein
MTEYLREPTWEDVIYLSKNLRQRDEEEVLSHGITPLYALSDGFEKSKPCFTIQSPTGEVWGMVGVGGGVDPTIGAIWMLCSKGIEERPMTLLKNSKVLLDRMWRETSYDLFYNYVYSQNQLHIDWLKWLGFTFLRTIKLGPYNRDFIEFVKLRG